jgi:NTP pyrophosphatase (non-canonical NTP hydrolase)
MSGPFAIGSNTWPGISKLIEETGEVQQVCGKLIALGGEANHWDGTNLKQRLEEELADLQAAIGFVIGHCDLDVSVITERATRKILQFSSWHTSNKSEV